MTCSSPSSMERLNYDRSLLRNSMECYSPLERAIKYSNSKVVLQRLVLIREFIDICHDVGYSKATTTLLPILRRLIKDNEEEVKKGALNILGNLVGFLVQSDPDKGYKTVITNIVPIIKNVLIGNDDPSISISIKEAACQACITLCSHLRHIDRVQSILSISLALANDLENDDSRCLAAWMLNGLAEYVGKDICKQFIIPQIKCLADDHSERVRKFTAMNLCEIIRINQDFNDLLPIFKRIISFDTNSVRLYAIKVLLGVSSSLKNISNEEFASSLITIQENCVELNLRLEYLKQLGPLITLFPNTELIPSQILDLFLTMDQLSIIEDNVNLNENNARFSDEFSENNIDDNDDNIMHANNGINDNMHVSNNNNDSINNDNMNNDNINNDNINNDNNLINNNSNINVRLISSNIEEVRGGLEDMITLIPFGNQLGLTFKKLESNDPAYFCSYSFASVFSHMGSKYWPAFSDLLSRLVGNSHHFVRLPIAASMPLILATALSCCEYSHLQNNNLNVHSNFNLNNIDSIKFNNSKIESTTSVFNENMEINLNERIKSENNTGNIQNEFNNTINTGIDLFYNNITKFPAKSIISGTVFKLPCSKGCLYKFDRLPFLLDIIGKLFEDDDIFVKRAICGCLSDIIKCLPLKQQIESVIRKFPDLLNSCKNDWRCRNILANQIRKICIELHIRNKEISKQENSSDNLFTGKYAQDYISPVAFSLLLDPVSTVRSTAINCISSLLRLSSPFLWHFFQNGGNIQDLPSPINSTPMSAIEKQDEKTFNFSNLNLNNNSDLQNGSLKNNSNLNDHINYNNCQSLQIHKQQTSTISYSSIYNPSPSSSKSLGKCNSNQFNENKSNYDVKLKTLFSMDEDNNCKLLNELALIWCILKTFAISTKYHHRQEYIKMCDRFIRDIPRKFFYTYFLNPLILLTSDPVKNVRTTWLRVIGPHIKDTGRLAQCANIIAACKLMNLTEVDNECNKYFSNIKFLPKNTLKRVEFLSMKEITNIIERTSQYDDILNWNQQPLIKHFNLYLEEVVGSLWCLDNVPGSNILTTSTSNYNSKKPFYSTEKCSDLTMEYEMMLLEVRPNSSPTNLNTLAPVITTDTNILEYGPYNDSIPNNYSMFSCRLGITRRSSEINETDSNSNNDQSLSESLAILHRPGIPRSYAKFICPIGTDITYNNDQPIYSEIKKVNIGETKKTESTNFSKEKILIFDHKLHEATRKIFMVDIARAATDDLF